jgi:hypothetical protein
VSAVVRLKMQHLACHVCWRSPLQNEGTEETKEEDQILYPRYVCGAEVSEA